jgi:anti-sigma regulatory factor (Ser/Thr protein kinase)
MPPSVHADLRLLITEVVTNSVRHAGLQPGDRIHVRVRVLADRVTASCTDAGPGYAAPAHGAPHDPAEGWGLYLVDTLADRWGTDHGEVVRTWFELDLDV